MRVRSEMSLDDPRLAEVLEVDKELEQCPALPGVDLELLVVAVDRMGRALHHSRCTEPTNWCSSGEWETSRSPVRACGNVP